MNKLLSYSFRMYGRILECPHPLLVIEILSLLGIFGQAYGDSWTLN